MTTIKLDNGVTITLTEQQLADINRQQNKITSIDQINSISDAEEILKNTNHTRYYESQFVRKKDWISYQVETIIKAVNYIDNGFKIWTPDFSNRNIEKFIAWMEYKEGSGWGFDCSSCRCYNSYAWVGVYFKNKSSVEKTINKYLSLYSKYLEGK